jgi:hypothetical protein
MPSSPLALVQTARELTLDEGTARIKLIVDHSWKMPWPYPRRGGVLRPFLNVSKRAAKQLVKKAWPDLDFRHQTAEGVIDLTGRRLRYMLDYGSYARLYTDGQEWSGRSGRAIATLPPSFDQMPTPLWLLDLLAGVTDATDLGAEDVRGARWRHLTGHADLSRAAEVVPGALAVPARERFEDLLALPVDVWLDDTHIRRIRFNSDEGGEQRSETLELWGFGARVDDLDWTRLPTFRSP